MHMIGGLAQGPGYHEVMSKKHSRKLQVSDQKTFSYAVDNVPLVVFSQGRCGTLFSNSTSHQSRACLLLVPCEQHCP